MDADELTIAEFEARDLPQIAEIEKDSYRTPWSTNLFRCEAANPLSHILVGRLPGRHVQLVAGYIVFWFVADEIQIHNITVRSGFRRQGIASRLLSRMLQAAHQEKVGGIRLEVRSSNSAARKLYENFGFVVDGVRHGYYSDTGEDALMMSMDPKRVETAGSTRKERGKS